MSWTVIAVLTAVSVAALVAWCVLYGRLRKYDGPFDPVVSVYAQRGTNHGWVVSFERNQDGSVPLSARPVDAAFARLSKVRSLANDLVRHRFYLKVVRVVQAKHWRDET